MAIDPAYMTPNLRWGLFVKDHPGCPPPKFELVSNDDSGVPPDFQKDECGDPVTGFIRCTIYTAAGVVAAVGYRGIPTSEKRRDGRKQEFVKNEESWVALCTMSLGRALKRAGYPDTTVDLRAFLLYEQRNAEIGRIRAGVEPVAAITAGQVDETVKAVGVAQPDQDRREQPPVDEQHPDRDPAAGDDEPAEGEVVPPPDAPRDDFTQADGSYPPSLAQAALLLSLDGQRRLLAWLDEHGYTPEVVRARRAALNASVSHASKLLGEEQAAAADGTPTPSADGATPETAASAS